MFRLVSGVVVTGQRFTESGSYGPQVWVPLGLGLVVLESRTGKVVLVKSYTVEVKSVSKNNSC